jgi:hypothetical protein
VDRASVTRVGIDVAAEFASQVRDRGENAASNDLALDFGEPDLHSVEPGRVRRREVKLYAWVFFEEIANLLDFMGGEVIENDMNLLSRRAPNARATADARKYVRDHEVVACPNKTRAV